MADLGQTLAKTNNIESAQKNPNDLKSFGSIQLRLIGLAVRPIAPIAAETSPVCFCYHSVHTRISGIHDCSG